MERLALALVLAFVALCAPASAATFTVTSALDAPDADYATNTNICAAAIAGNPCTLRAALQEASSIAGQDQIVLPAGEYNLSPSYGELAIDSSVVIDGGGARTTRVTAAANSRVMTVGANLTLRDVTLRGGNVTVSSGTAYGGGVSVTTGDVLMERVAIRDNTITGAGTAANVAGGGIGVSGVNSSLTLLRSLVAGNRSLSTAANTSASGGGVYVGAAVTIRRTTVTQNLARPLGLSGIFATGGGVEVAGPAIIEHSTITGNEASTVSGPGFKRGGNLYVTQALTLSSSVIAGGSATTTGPNCAIVGGSVTEPSPNLSDNADCLGAGSVRNTPVQLGTLADNGGPTDTQLPAIGSPALNGAVGCGTVPVDQRGNALPAGPACDFGAVEYGADRSVTLQASKASAAAGEDVTLIATIQNAGLDDAPGETLTLELPAGVTATTATSTLGTCTTGASVVCTLGSLNRSAGATITATIRASGGSFGVTARRGGGVPDQSAANDAATVAITGLGAPGPAGPAGAADRTAPAITGLKLAARPTLRKGAQLSLRLSEAATVRVVAERLLPGRRKGSRCVAKGSGKRCVRVVRLATTTVTATSGAVTITLAGKRLKRGSVRFTLVATDAAGNAAKAARVTGTVRSR